VEAVALGGLAVEVGDEDLVAPAARVDQRQLRTRMGALAAADRAAALRPRREVERELADEGVVALLAVL